MTGAWLGVTGGAVEKRIQEARTNATQGSSQHQGQAGLRRQCRLGLRPRQQAGHLVKGMSAEGHFRCDTCVTVLTSGEGHQEDKAILVSAISQGPAFLRCDKVSSTYRSPSRTAGLSYPLPVSIPSNSQGFSSLSIGLCCVHS